MTTRSPLHERVREPEAEVRLSREALEAERVHQDEKRAMAAIPVRMPAGRRDSLKRAA